MIGQIYYDVNGVFKLISYKEGVSYRLQEMTFDDLGNLIELDSFRDLTVNEFKKLEKISNEF